MRKMVLKDIYKGTAKCKCHFQVWEKSDLPYKLGNLKTGDVGRPIACEHDAAGDIKGIPLCKSHYDYIRFYAGGEI